MTSAGAGLGAGGLVGLVVGLPDALGVGEEDWLGVAVGFGVALGLGLSVAFGPEKSIAISSWVARSPTRRATASALAATIDVMMVVDFLTRQTPLRGFGL